VLTCALDLVGARGRERNPCVSRCYDPKALPAPHRTSLADIHDATVFDVVVVGAGGAGMAAALFAAMDGARVLLVESTAYVGGTTAYSAGVTWVPGTPMGLKLNPEDSIDAARRYLESAVGMRTASALREAFLAHGPATIQALKDATHVHFRARRTQPDHLSDLKDAAMQGRALEPLPFDGRLLGADFDLVRPPPPETLVIKGMMVNRSDTRQLLSMFKSWSALRHGTALLLRHARDRLRHQRGTRLLRGNALVGRLLLSLREHRVTLLTRTRVASLGDAVGSGTPGVQQLTLVQDGVTRQVRVTGGVVLATGGFNRHPLQRAARLPGVEMSWCPGAPGHTGTAHTLAENAGATYGTGAMSNAYWAPVSLRARRDGSVAAHPHLGIDRAKPRMLAVDANGQRFVNEASAHHLFALQMLEAQRGSPTIPAYLITDADGLRKYGLGLVRPQGWGLKSALADGYVVSAPTLRALADKLEIRALPLAASVERFNSYWADGVDTAFDRGGTEAERAGGDADADGPNPSLGPINTPPFYAVRLYPGDIAAATGFVTDAHACALDAQGHVIPGLYAVGNDMHHIMGGVDPAPGIHLGPALVFGRLAALHASARARQATNDTSAADPATDAMHAAVQAAQDSAVQAAQDSAVQAAQQTVALDPTAKVNASTPAMH
jgi:hypothetical protein